MNLDNHQNRNAIEFTCNWRAAVQQEEWERGTLGYLLSWSGCGGLQLKNDTLNLKTPNVNVDGKAVCGPMLKCAGVIESLRYQGGTTGPIRIRAYLQRELAADIRSHFAKPLSSLTVKLAWLIVDYDEGDSTWFGASHLKSPKVAEACIDSVGGNPQVFLDSQPTSLVDDTSSGSYIGFEFQVVPASKKSTQLEFAAGAKERWINVWGSSK